jgi:uncharacterized protein (TIGR03067 family)
VTVNGKEAWSRSADFAEWEATVDPLADGRLTARAVDRSGNEEPRAHTVTFDGVGLRAVVAHAEPPQPNALPKPTKPGGDAKGLIGRWRVEVQQRAGRPIERPRAMSWAMDGDRIALIPGAMSLGYRLDPAESGHLTLNAKAAVYFGIYHVNGDALTLCIGPAQAAPAYDPKSKPDAKTRPTEFSPEAGTVLVLRRTGR